MSTDNFNADELVAPSFITEALIESVIKNQEDDPYAHLINYEIRPGSSVGDHYASVMFKIIVTYGSKGKIIVDRRFILKTIPEDDGPKKDFLENSPAFKNETIMYTETLPAMEMILRANGEEPWWPNLVYSQKNPYILIFDDLTMENYEVVKDQLNFDELEIITDKIACYHALSLVLIESGHKQLTEFESVYSPVLEEFFKPLTVHIENFGKVVQTWSGFEKIGRDLQEVGPQLMFRFLNSDNKQRDDRFFVLNHGDFTLRNLMFQRNGSGDLAKVVFLDFQAPAYYSIGMDLVGLLTSMGNADVRRKGQEVIKQYHEKLVAQLKKFGYSGRFPTVIDIQMELLRISDYYANTTLFNILMARITGIDLTEMFDVREESRAVVALREVFNDPEVVEDFKAAVTYFYNLGVFNQKQ